MDYNKIFDLIEAIKRTNRQWGYSDTKNPRGFNIFPVISGRFHQENIHSDILKAFLSTNSQSEYEFGQHCEGDLYLQVFIDMINAERRARRLAPIDGSIYKRATVGSELIPTDLFIIAGKHCIIIENKINERQGKEQPPRYYGEMKREGYVVDAIVYLTKVPKLRPTGDTRSSSENKEALSLITMIPLNNVPDRVSLLRDWVGPCCRKASEEACVFTLRQYQSLILYTNPKYTLNFKKIAAMDNLLNCLQEQPSEVTADVFEFSKMVRDLPEAMTRSLREKIRNLIADERLVLPHSIGSWAKTNSCVILFESLDVIWVNCFARQKGAYHLGFRGESHEDEATGYTVGWYPEYDVEVSSDAHGAYLSKEFNFGKEGEQELLDFIRKLLRYAKKAGLINEM